MVWQPAVTKRGRNITRPRHFYTDDIQISSDEEKEAVKPAKRSRRGGQQTIGNYFTPRANSGITAKAFPLKAPAQVNSQVTSPIAVVEILQLSTVIGLLVLANAFLRREIP